MTFKATVAGAAHEPIIHCPNCNHEIISTTPFSYRSG
ncbi:hypothetical protein ACVIJ6_007766 [Bradyrhizobium sp. USDA 4369]|jgi:hypothetical protein